MVEDLEVELLLDIEGCNLTGSNRREILRRYQKAVQRHLENGGTRPLTLSEYLAAKREKARIKASQLAASSKTEGLIEASLPGAESLVPA